VNRPNPPESALRESDQVLRAIVCAGVIANYLRRTAGHRVDVSWLVSDCDYARHILGLADRSRNTAIIERARQLEYCLFGRAP
jgi:hypothetical protein